MAARAQAQELDSPALIEVGVSVQQLDQHHTRNRQDDSPEDIGN